MKRIKLTQGKYALVDDSDYDRLNQWEWSPDKNHNNIYATRRFRRADKKLSKVCMHRYIMGLSTGDVRVIDHIDFNGLNNQRANLRICTRTENARYRKKHCTNKSGYKGVCWHQNRWQSTIKVDRKAIFLGRFTCLIEAAKAYDEAAKKHFGEFAKTNFNQKKGS